MLLQPRQKNHRKFSHNHPLHYDRYANVFIQTWSHEETNSKTNSQTNTKTLFFPYKQTFIFSYIKTIFKTIFTTFYPSFLKTTKEHISRSSS